MDEPSPYPLPLWKGEARNALNACERKSITAAIQKKDVLYLSMKALAVNVFRSWPWLAASCSGLLYTGCIAPFNLTWLCWIALTPLIAAIWFSGARSRHRWLRNLLLGYVTGLTFFWTAFSWLTTVTVLGWFVLQFYMAIYLALWAWFCGLVRPREIRREPGSSK